MKIKLIATMMVIMTSFNISYATYSSDEDMEILASRPAGLGGPPGFVDSDDIHVDIHERYVGSERPLYKKPCFWFCVGAAGVLTTTLAVFFSPKENEDHGSGAGVTHTVSPSMNFQNGSAVADACLWLLSLPFTYPYHNVTSNKWFNITTRGSEYGVEPSTFSIEYVGNGQHNLHIDCVTGADECENKRRTCCLAPVEVIPESLWDNWNSRFKQIGGNWLGTTWLRGNAAKDSRIVQLGLPLIPNPVPTTECYDDVVVRP